MASGHTQKSLPCNSLTSNVEKVYPKPHYLSSERPRPAVQRNEALD